MPSQVKIISARNSREWDDLVAAAPAGVEHIYGGIVTQERADKVRRAIRTASRRDGTSTSKVFWKACDKPGRCPFGSDCAYHVSYTIFGIETAREYKAKQAAAARR